MSIEVVTEDGFLLLSTIYRSPNSDEVNDDNLLKLIQEISEKQNKDNVIVGDFNLPQIDWTNYLSLTGEDNIHYKFIENLRDCFLLQHINEVTRMRGGDRGTSLDLIISSDDTSIDNIKIESPIGRSDHAVINFSCQVKAEEDKRKRIIYNYERGNYDLMRERLNIRWESFFGTHSSKTA